MIEALPLELLEQILSENNLEINDIVNFSTTCHHFRSVVNNSNVIWRAKFFERWPQFYGIFDHEIYYDWFKESKICMEIQARSMKILSDMSPKFCKRYELSETDLSDWKDMVEEHPRAYYYIVNKLMNVINDHRAINFIDVVPANTPGNKTLKYYGLKALRYVRQLHLTEEWHQYMSSSVEDQVLERGAVLVAQWCQPAQDITVEDISDRFDGIANRVKEFLKTTNPKHPLLSAVQEQLDYWKKHNLIDNQWNRWECKQVIEALNNVLFKQMGFLGNNEMYFMLENSFINEVISKRRGLPITLAILYESIARRLGVKCEAISFPAHFLLRWSENYTNDDGTGESFYIDVFNKGQFITRGTCPRLSYDQMGTRKLTFSEASARQVVERMANNLEFTGRQHLLPNGRITRLRSTLELLRMISPTDMTCVLNLARLYMLYNMDTQHLINSLLEIQPELDQQGKNQANQIVQMLQDHETHNKDARGALYPRLEPCHRPANLRFAVGMVMQHKVLDYRCVIYDWDPLCLASPEWQEQMNIAALKYKVDQPFYNVLVEDGSHRYVAQENILPTDEAGYIYENQDLGRHFSHFFENHYVPNAEKQAEYPFDEPVRKYFHERLVFGLRYCQGKDDTDAT